MIFNLPDNHHKTFAVISLAFFFTSIIAWNHYDTREKDELYKLVELESSAVDNPEQASYAVKMKLIKKRSRILDGDRNTMASVFIVIVALSAALATYNLARLRANMVQKEKDGKEKRRLELEKLSLEVDNLKNLNNSKLSVQ